MRMQSNFIRAIAAVACVVVVLTAEFAAAQFTGPIIPPTVPNLPVPSNAGGASAKTIQQIMMLRYLQGRSGGGVRRGTPQFIPFGNQGFMDPSTMNAAPFDQSASSSSAASSSKKTAEEKKAEYQAAREEKKKQARERAEKRKAARSSGSSASGSKNPA